MSILLLLDLPSLFFLFLLFNLLLEDDEGIWHRVLQLESRFNCKTLMHFEVFQFRFTMFFCLNLGLGL